jgi:signal peptidase II
VRGLQERGTVAALSSAPGAIVVPARPEETRRHTHLKRLAVALAIAVAVVTVDQITKTLVVHHIHDRVHLFGPLSLTLGFNTGSAFSFFTGRAPVLAVVALVLIAVLLALAWRARSMVAVVALGLVLGGAIGNLSDRLFRGHNGAVVDFVELPRWPIFNVADACIVTGIAIFVILQLRRWATDERADRKPPPAP